MQINLNQQEIEEGLRYFLESTGMDLFGQKLVVDFTAKRNEAGLSASIEIVEDPEAKHVLMDLIDAIGAKVVKVFNTAQEVAEVAPTPEVKEVPVETPSCPVPDLAEAEDPPFDGDPVKQPPAVGDTSDEEVATAEQEPETVQEAEVVEEAPVAPKKKSLFAPS